MALWTVLVDVDVEAAATETDDEVDDDVVVELVLVELVDAAATETDDELVVLEDAKTKLVLVAVDKLVRVVDDELLDGVVAATVTRAV